VGHIYKAEEWLSNDHGGQHILKYRVLGLYMGKLHPRGVPEANNEVTQS
jgi:hypothetical protein